MSVETIRIAQRKRMKVIDDQYRTALKVAEAKFNRVYDEKMAEHGLEINKLMDHHSFPIEFHEGIAEAQVQFLVDLEAAKEAQRNGSSQLPRKGIVRAN